MIVVIAFSIIVCGRITERISRIGYEIKSASVEEMGSNRVYLWQCALESVPDNWMFGVGLDNLKYAFTSNPRFVDGMWLNEKAHNEYIHYLATQGVFQFITYMTLLVYAVVRGVKTVLHTEDKSNKYMTWIFLGMFAAYSTQAMFNSSVINIAPYFWITIGMCVPYKNQKLKIKTNSN
jgi:O-antigen ligase